MAKYIVIEIQTTAEGNVSILKDSYAGRPEAEQKYHTVLAAAAVSNVAVHVGVLMTNEGFVIESRKYEHDAQPEPEQNEGE